jgi:hypothetical protein
MSRCDFWSGIVNLRLPHRPLVIRCRLSKVNERSTTHVSLHAHSHRNDEKGVSISVVAHRSCWAKHFAQHFL